MKAHEIRHEDEHYRKSMLNPPKAHTRASAMANTFVNQGTISKTAVNQENAKSLFKMKKFMQVEPRTSSKNPTYKPTKRSATT